MKVQISLGGTTLAILVGLAGTAAAQTSAPSLRSTPTIEEREAEAKIACLGGRPDRGIEILAQLYTETNEPNYLYNQGRCFQQNSRHAEALSRFREYLRKAQGLSPQERDEVQTFIKECEAQKDQTGGPGPTAVVSSAGDEAARAASTGRMRTIGYAAAGVGVAALAVGAVMSWQVKAKQDAFEKDHKLSFSQTEYNSGQRVEVLQWVGYAVGVVALGTGGIFYYLGSQHHEGGGVALVPVVTGTTAGALLRMGL
jgi:hypothetical protein